MIRPDHIETVLLHDQPCTLNTHALLLALNAGQANATDHFELRNSQGDDYALLENSRLHVSIRQFDQPMPAETFTRALDAPIMTLGRVKFAPRIRRHSCAVLVTVGLGSLRDDGERDINTAAYGADLTQMRQFITLSHLVARFLVQTAPPLAVHWRQSNRLLLPEQVLDQPANSIPVPHCYDPAPFSSGTRVRGKAQSGLRAIGSENVTGRTVVLHESALNLSQGCRLIDDVLRLSLEGSGDFRDGQRLALDGWPVCEIRRRPPSEAFPAGTVELTPDNTLPPPNRAPEENLRRVFRRPQGRQALSGRISHMRDLIAALSYRPQFQLR